MKADSGSFLLSKRKYLLSNYDGQQQPSCSTNHSLSPPITPHAAITSTTQHNNNNNYNKRVGQQQTPTNSGKSTAKFASLTPSACVVSALWKIIFFAYLLAVVSGQYQFSSNEDKRNNFEREFLSFGKRAVVPLEMERNFMSFGKRAQSDFGRQFMPFGKRFVSVADVLDAPMMDVYEKKSFGGRDYPRFIKRAPDADFQRDFMAFGRRK